MCGVCRAVRVAKASPRGTLSFGDPPGDAAPRADRAPPGPTVVGVEGLGAGGTRPSGLSGSFFRQVQARDAGGPGARKIAVLGACPFASGMYCGDSDRMRVGTRLSP